MQPIPMHAKLMHTYVSHDPDSTASRLEWWEGTASDGYKTDYMPRRAAWVKYYYRTPVIVSSRKVRIHNIARLSGRNINANERHIAKLLATGMITEAGKEV